LERLILKWVVKLLLIQWILLVGKTALKVYSGKQEEVEIEAEALLMDFENLMDESEKKLPEDVNLIVESSKNKIIFSPTVISWRKVGQIYFTLTDQIERHYHSDSAASIY
jgi:hypothetical protein